MEARSFTVSDVDKSETKRSGERASELKEPVTSYINFIATVFRDAQERIPTTDLPQIPMQRVDSSDIVSYEGRRSHDISTVRKLMSNVKKERGTYTQEDREAYFNGGNVLGDVYDDPILKRYSRFRSSQASGLRDAAAAWEDLRPAKGTDTFSPDELGFNNNDRQVRNIENPSETYFHDVLVADLKDVVPGELVATDIVIFSALANEQNGQKLMEATTKAIQRVVQLASDPGTEQQFHNDYLNTITIARKRDSLGKSEEDIAKAELHTGTRMMTEAIITVAQTTALLLSGLDRDYDIKQALESLDNHGVFKLFGLAPMGMIGPLAVNGTRWNSDEVLDTELLDSDGEFALSNQLRRNLIDRHTLIRSKTLGNVAVSANNKQVPLRFAGCPAKPDDMKFIIGLILDEL